MDTKDLKKNLEKLPEKLRSVYMETDSEMLLSTVLDSIEKDKALNFKEMSAVLGAINAMLTGMLPPEKIDLFFEGKLDAQKKDSVCEIIKKELVAPLAVDLDLIYKNSSETVPRPTYITAGTTPIYRPEGFGKPQTQKNFDILLSQEEGPVAYQSGVSLKDSLLGGSGPQNGAANPTDSSFAKKLDALDAMAKGKTTNAQKEDKYRENPNS